MPDKKVTRRTLVMGKCTSVHLWLGPTRPYRFKLMAPKSFIKQSQSNALEGGNRGEFILQMESSEY